MSRFSTPQLPGVLTGSFDHYWSADLVYNGERRLADVPISDVKFDEDGSGKIQQSGSCTIVWTDEFGRSMSPREVTDAFAPFGAQLRVYSNIVAGPFSDRVQYGVFEITDVPSSYDEDMRFLDRWVTVGSVVQLELKELTAGVEAETFDVPSAPTSLTSTWDEAARVTGLQTLRTITDKPITRSILYPDSKLDATYDLFDLMLDAVPHMTADGALSARPNAWPAPSRRIRRGRDGQVVHVGDAMSPARVYNRVVVRATSGDQRSVLAIAEVTEGPLRCRNSDGSRSPFRARTYHLSSEFVTDVAQAQAWANSTLPQVSTLRAVVVPVKMTFDPLLERGDVVIVERSRQDLLCRVLTISRGSERTQDITVEVASITPRAYSG